MEKEKEKEKKSGLFGSFFQSFKPKFSFIGEKTKTDEKEKTEDLKHFETENLPKETNLKNNLIGIYSFYLSQFYRKTYSEFEENNFAILKFIQNMDEEMHSSKEMQNVLNETIYEISEEEISKDFSIGLFILFSVPDDIEKSFEILQNLLSKTQNNQEIVHFARFYFVIKALLINKMDFSRIKSIGDVEVARNLLVEKISEMKKDGENILVSKTEELLNKEGFFNQTQQKTEEAKKFFSDLQKSEVFPKNQKDLEMNADEFLLNEKYRKEILEKLFEKPNLQLLSKMIDFGDKMGISKLDILLVFLKTAFLASRKEFGSSLLGTFINDNKEIFLENAEKTQKFVRTIFPILKGTSHIKLQIYYKLLIECEAKNRVEQNTPTQEEKTLLVHLKMLTTIKNISPQHNYKNLIENVEEELIRIVEEKNVEQISEIANFFKIISGKKITKSLVFKIFLTNLLSGQIPTDLALNRFQKYQKYFNRLSSLNLYEFVSDCCQDRDRFSLDLKVKKQICEYGIILLKKKKTKTKEINEYIKEFEGFLKKI
eukprot:Anaeramoba_ignava/a609804_23.p1 GENE.a609804_23~~a609804_23.p1  ORF type:complete len:542 (-),score=232.08 a609804_23:19-1644(-)